LGAADWVRQTLGFPADSLQASVLDTHAKRGVLNCSRQWGKSTVTAAKAVHHAFHHAASLILVVSPSARQSAEFLRKAAAFARKLGIRPKGDGDNQISLLFPNQSRMVGLPATEATNRGFSAVSLILIDEAARVSDQLYMSLRPMLAVSGGFFYDTWVQGGPEWERITAPATACPRIPPAFLEEERATMGERCFRQEYLCEFEDSVSGVFCRDLLDSAITHDILPLPL
jgi:hypothetical protein